MQEIMENGMEDNNNEPVEDGFLKKLISSKKKEKFPVVVLKDAVVFPGLAIPLAIRGELSIKAVKFSQEKNDGIAFLVAQNGESKKEVKSVDDIYKVGTVCRIRDVESQEDGTMRVLVEGLNRAKVEKVLEMDPFMKVEAQLLGEPEFEKTEEIKALMYSVINQFKSIVSMGANVPLDVMMVILNMKNPFQLCDLIVSNLDLKVSEKQEMLEKSDAKDKLDTLSKFLGKQTKVLKMAQKLEENTGKELEKMQKEMYLREKMKSIQKELGELGGKDDTAELEEKIKKAGMTKKVEEEVLKEYNRMKGMPSFSPEVSYLRTYLDWMIGLPWKSQTKSTVNVKKAKKILNDDHYGLDKVKERILEYLSVRKLTNQIQGPILCFVGPPGVGKTSIGKSIARALGREFHRISLGGVKDEAEIRGHRRTYVGAMPGRIIQGINSVKTKNPVFMLDEIDKVGNDFRGDPSSALLEALDPQQNKEFVDNYLGVPFDLSDVMFITTANVLDTIPPALRDRMEVIEFPGYTEDEKFNIAKKYLIPRQLKENGIKREQCMITDPSLRRIVREYTKEAGVRNLERQIATVCRKMAKSVASGGKGDSNVTISDLRKYLGAPLFTQEKAETKDEVGVVTGLAWTPVGGDILHIEVSRMPGKGELRLTGQLGKVMKESAEAAYSFARGIADKLGVKEGFYKNDDIHIHVPAGAIPKDGPSAGVAMATALISVLAGKKVKRNIAMTGEVTLRGKILPIGGIKEKVLAARQAGVKTVLLPEENRNNLAEIPKDVQKDLKIVFVKIMDDVLKESIEDYGNVQKDKKPVIKAKKKKGVVLPINPSVKPAAIKAKSKKK